MSPGNVDNKTGDTYYVRSMGRVTGPFDAQRLEKLRTRGQFGAGAEVSSDRHSWRPMSSLAPSASTPGAARPAKAESSEDVIAISKPEPVAKPKEAEPPADNPEWRYALNSASHGPVTRVELLQLFVEGTINDATPVWREGMLEWLPFSAVAELKRIPLAGTAPSSKRRARDSDSPYRYSNFWRRVAAFLFDTVILNVIGAGLGFLIGVSIFPSGLDERQIYVIVVIASILLNWLYYAALEASQFQGTFGKLAMELKVTTLDGERISFGQATGRYFGKLLSGLMLGIGFLMIGFTAKRQGLHDVLSDCLVLDQES